jgi:hypothetical protein
MSTKLKEHTYKVGEMVKVSDVWYHVIVGNAYNKNDMKIHENPGEIDRSQMPELYGFWIHPRFVQASRPAPSGVSYTKRGTGYKVKYMSIPLVEALESYVVIHYESGEEVGDYVHATLQSAEIELREIVGNPNQ